MPASDNIALSSYPMCWWGSGYLNLDQNLYPDLYLSKSTSWSRKLHLDQDILKSLSTAKKVGAVVQSSIDFNQLIRNLKSAQRYLSFYHFRPFWKRAANLIMYAATLIFCALLLRAICHQVYPQKFITVNFPQIVLEELHFSIYSTLTRNLVNFQQMVFW